MIYSMSHPLPQSARCPRLLAVLDPSAVSCGAASPRRQRQTPAMPITKPNRMPPCGCIMASQSCRRAVSKTGTCRDRIVASPPPAGRWMDAVAGAICLWPRRACSKGKSDAGPYFPPFLKPVSAGSRVVILGIAAIVVTTCCWQVNRFAAGDACPTPMHSTTRVERLFVENDLTGQAEIKLLEILAQSGTAFADTLNSYRMVIFVSADLCHRHDGGGSGRS